MKEAFRFAYYVLNTPHPLIFESYDFDDNALSIDIVIVLGQYDGKTVRCIWRQMR